LRAGPRSQDGDGARLWFRIAYRRKPKRTANRASASLTKRLGGEKEKCGKHPSDSWAIQLGSLCVRSSLYASERNIRRRGVALFVGRQTLRAASERYRPKKALLGAALMQKPVKSAISEREEREESRGTRTMHNLNARWNLAHALVSEAQFWAAPRTDGNFLKNTGLRIADAQAGLVAIIFLQKTIWRCTTPSDEGGALRHEDPDSRTKPGRTSYRNARPASRKLSRTSRSP